jgi:hypothetical protein
VHVIARMTRFPALPGLLALFVLAVAACTSAPALPLPDAGPLAVIEASGGHCRTGDCSSRVQISAGGSAQRDDGAPVPIPPVVFDRLVQAIRGTDFAAVQARPFVGDCPTAYDGQEFTYSFATPAGPVSFSSCEVAIDATHPLFVVLEEAVAAAP